MTTIISVKDLIKKYNKATTNAVDGATFDVKEGEFFAFLGPNGAGKTTTISILTTTLAKTSGDITIAGFDIEKQSAKVRRNVGIIFQNPSLDLNLTGEENIRFHAILYGLFPFRPLYSLMPAGYKTRLAELAKILGLENDIFKAVKTFSGGMKRKLEIIRSLMHKPKVLFLDEPTVGLDPEARKNLWEYLRTIMKDEKTTVFLTTHYLDEAEDADRICIINHGKIIKDGSPEQIKRSLIRDYMTLEIGHKGELITELEKKKIKYDDAGEFKVFIQNREMQDFLKNLKTEIRGFKTHAPSLEEAYLEIIGEKESGDKDVTQRSEAT